MSSISIPKNTIQETLKSLSDVSTDVLARKDLNSTKQATDLLAAINSMSKDLTAARSQSPLSESLKAGLNKNIEDIEPGLQALIIENSKMSALTGRLNTNKKVSTDESNALVETLKNAQSDLYALSGLMDGNPPPKKEKSAMYKAILAEFGSLPKLSGTQITIKSVSR